MKDRSLETSCVTSQAGGFGYSYKVRKPYSITKQREKWKDDEHQRFVEALKLYGRAWRQIEEYVGTKTAIQIRSHAQKFFAKVSRDSDGCGEGLVSPEDIPPPRPKKKPLHPYPRKPENREDTDSNKIECLTDDGGKCSPTSVVSPVNSDIVESTVAEMNSSCLSPNSGATDALSGNLLTSINLYAVPDTNSTKKFELLPQETESTMESPFYAAQSKSFKLFGKTILVVDDAGQSSDVIGNTESHDDKDEGHCSTPNSIYFGFIPNVAPSCPPYPQANKNGLMMDQCAWGWYYTFLQLYPYLSATVADSSFNGNSRAAVDFNTMSTDTTTRIADKIESRKNRFP